MRTRSRRLPVALLALAAWIGAGAALAARPAGSGDPAGKVGEGPDRRAARYETGIRPILAKYCYPCHGNGEDEGGLRLDRYAGAAQAVRDADTWRRVAGRLAADEMPPEGEPRPAPAERAEVLGFARAVVAAATPGRTTLRRLNRHEYENTIHDLLGVDLPLARDLPPDDTGYGFDNDGDVLSLSPLHLEKYLAAADRALRAALVLAPPVVRRTRAVAGAELEATTGGAAGASGRWLWSAGEAFARLRVPVAGRYRVRIVAAAEQAGDEPAKMAATVDGREIGRFDVPERPGSPGTREAEVKLPAGEHRFGAAFLNDYYHPEARDPARRDRNLLVVRLEVDGPLDYRPPPPPKSHRDVFIVEPGPDLPPRDAAGIILTRFVARAFRRPVEPAEVERYLSLYDEAAAEGESFPASVGVALKAILCSPNFLFLVERPGPGPLDGYELATRLSYFLWSGPPDDALLALAASGRLAEPDVLAAQAERMLKDPKANRFFESFTGQWLGLRALAGVTPDPAKFPEFTEALRADMRRETELFFASVVREDRPLTDFLVSRDVFVNGRLAKLYGIPGVEGDAFRRVRAGPERGGVLTQASILTLTSYPTRTSPVRRGKWILGEILGDEPPPPPANVPPLPDSARDAARRSLRDRMERHRTDPACAVCHARMDPIGFAFEHYDAIGRWRAKDGEFPVNARGVLPDGTAFDGVAGLRRVLLLDRARFVDTFVRSMTTYALGRGLVEGDRPEIDSIDRGVAASGGRFSAVVRGIVRSRLFRFRGGEEGGS